MADGFVVEVRGTKVGQTNLRSGSDIQRRIRRNRKQNQTHEGIPNRFTIEIRRMGSYRTDPKSEANIQNCFIQSRDQSNRSVSNTHAVKIKRTEAYQTDLYPESDKQRCARQKWIQNQTHKRFIGREPSRTQKYRGVLGRALSESEVQKHHR